MNKIQNMDFRKAKILGEIWAPVFFPHFLSFGLKSRRGTVLVMSGGDSQYMRLYTCVWQGLINSTAMGARTQVDVENIFLGGMRDHVISKCLLEADLSFVHCSLLLGLCRLLQLVHLTHRSTLPFNQEWFIILSSNVCSELLEIVTDELLKGNSIWIDLWIKVNLCQINCLIHIGSWILICSCLKWLRRHFYRRSPGLFRAIIRVEIIDVSSRLEDWRRTSCFLSGLLI